MSKMRRNGQALLVAAALTVSGVACSNTPKSTFGREVGVAFARQYEKDLIKEYGEPLSSFPDNDADVVDMSTLKNEQQDEDKLSIDELSSGVTTIRASLVSGQWRIKALTPNIDPELVAWVAQRIRERINLINAAAQENQLKFIDVNFDYLDDPHFSIGGELDSISLTANIQFTSLATSITTADFDDALVHETTHALVEKISRDIAAGRIHPTVQKYLDVCDEVHSYAMNEYSTQPWLLYDVYMQFELARNSSKNPKQDPAFDYLLNVLSQGNVASLEPLNEPKWFGGQIDKGSPAVQFGTPGKNCASNSGSRMLGLSQERTGLIDIKKYPDRTPSGVGPESNADITQAGIEVDEAWDSTIYQYEREGNVIDLDDASSTDGHPYDNAGELSASLSADLAYPAKFAQGIDSAQPDQQELINKQIKAYVAMMHAYYPQLDSFFQKCSQQYFSATQSAQAMYGPNAERSCGLQR